LDFVDDIYNVLESYGPDVDVEEMIGVLIFIAVEIAYHHAESDKDADYVVDHFVDKSKKLRKVN
jgi:hypothetical protein